MGKWTNFILGVLGVLPGAIGGYEYLAAMLTGEESMIGSMTIRPSVWFSLFVTGTGVFAWASRHAFVRIAAFAYRRLLPAGRFLAAMEEHCGSWTEHFLTRRERLCFKLNKLGISALHPLEKPEVWTMYLARMMAYAKDGRIGDARAAKVGLRQWTPPSNP